MSGVSDSARALATGGAASLAAGGATGSATSDQAVAVFSVDPDIPWGHEEALTAPLPLSKSCRWPGGFCAPFADARAEAEYVRFLYAYNTTSGALLVGSSAVVLVPGLVQVARQAPAVNPFLVLSGCAVALLGSLFLLVASKLIVSGTIAGARRLALLHRLCVSITLGVFGVFVLAIERSMSGECDYVPRALDPGRELHPDCSNALRDYVVFGLIVLAAATQLASDGVFTSGLLLVLQTVTGVVFPSDSEEDASHVLARRTAVSAWITAVLWGALQARESFYRRRFGALVSAHIDAERNRRRIADVRRLVAAQLPASLARRLAESQATEAAAAVDIDATGGLRLSSSLLRDARGDATVLVTQVADYGAFSAQFVDPCEAPTALGHIFALFDVATSVFGVDRTGAFGDAYTAAVNLFGRPAGRGSAARAVRQLARFALWQQGLDEARVVPLKACLVTGELRGAVVGGARSLRFVLSGGALWTAWQMLAGSVGAGEVWACPESTRLATVAVAAASASRSEGLTPPVSRSGASRGSFPSASDSMTNTAAMSMTAVGPAGTSPMPTMRIVPCDAPSVGGPLVAVTPAITSPAALQNSTSSAADSIEGNALVGVSGSPSTLTGLLAIGATFRILSMVVAARRDSSGADDAATSDPPVHYTREADAIVRTVLLDRAHGAAASPHRIRGDSMSGAAGNPLSGQFSDTVAANAPDSPTADGGPDASAQGQQDRLGWTAFVDREREGQYRDRAAAEFPKVQHDAAVALLLCCVVFLVSHTADVAFMQPDLLPEPASAGMLCSLGLFALVIVWTRRYRRAGNHEDVDHASKPTATHSTWQQAAPGEWHYAVVALATAAGAAYCWSLVFLAGSFHRNVATLHFVVPYTLAVTSFRHTSVAASAVVITVACTMPILHLYWDTPLRYVAVPCGIAAFMLYVLAVGYSQRLSFAATLAAERAEAAVLATVTTMYSVLDGLAPRHVSLRAGVPRRPEDAAAAEQIALTFLSAATRNTPVDGDEAAGEDVEARLAQLGAVMRGDHSKLGHDHYDTVTVAAIAFRRTWCGDGDGGVVPPQQQQQQLLLLPWSAEDDAAIAAAVSAALETADPLDRHTPRVRVLRAMGRYVMLGAGFHDDQPPPTPPNVSAVGSATSSRHSNAPASASSGAASRPADAAEDAASPPAAVLEDDEGAGQSKSSPRSHPAARGTVPLMPAHEGAATLAAVLRALDAHLAAHETGVVFEAGVASEEAFGGLVGHGFMHYGVWGAAVSQSERLLEAARRPPSRADFGPDPARDCSRIVVMPATHRLLDEHRDTSGDGIAASAVPFSAEPQQSGSASPPETDGTDFQPQQPWAVHGLPFLRPRIAVLERRGVLRHAV